MTAGVQRFSRIVRPLRAWRERLRAEVGASRASEHNVEASLADGTLEVLSMDWIALGGEPAWPTRASYAAPAWTATAWVALPLSTRVRLWIGPTKM